MRHNEDFKLLDERMRFYIQAVAENGMAERAFAGATLRGILDPRGRSFLKSILAEMRPATLDGEPAIAGSVPAADLETFSERLARALYFRHYREPLRGKFASINTHMVLRGHDNRSVILALEEMALHLPQGDSSDTRVFTYWYGKTVEEGGSGFLLKMRFYETVTFYFLGLDLSSCANPPRVFGPGS